MSFEFVQTKQAPRCIVSLDLYYSVPFISIVMLIPVLFA